jgi:hypothetical protein
MCRRSSPSEARPTAPARPLPPALARVVREVERARELRFLRPVAARAVSREVMDRLLTASLARDYPAGEAAREGLVLTTMGALPAGTDLLSAIRTYQTGQVIGFYDPDTKRLVFEGDARLTPFQRMTLAHELTHALDDQAFGLSRLDHLDATCQDDRALAFLSLAEGDAVVTQLRWAIASLSPAEVVRLQAEAAAYPSPPPVPRFVEDLLTFPYPAGQAFVQALLDRGGEAAVDRAFRDPPVSTEQVLHPDRYPSDRPQAVQAPDLSTRLGPGWRGLDVAEVGEAFLRILLEVHIPDSEAESAAAGWDGGQYRAWRDGRRVAVVLDTVWDSVTEAARFANAMDRWGKGRPVEVRTAGARVRVLFATDRPTLAQLAAAAGPP